MVMQSFSLYILAAIPAGVAVPIYSLWFPLSLCVVPILTCLLLWGLRARTGSHTRQPRTMPVSQLVLFRFLLEVAVWLVVLALFAAIALFFSKATDVRLLLLPFAFTVYVLRGCAWQLVGGRGFSVRGSRQYTSGLQLQGWPLAAWTAFGLALNFGFDVALFVGAGMCDDLFAW